MFRAVIYISRVIIITILTTDTVHSSPRELSPGEIRQHIVGRCFRSDSGRMQLSPDGGFSFKAIDPVYSYDGTYVIITNGIKSNKGRITRFYIAEDRIYTKLHNSNALVRIRTC